MTDTSFCESLIGKTVTYCSLTLGNRVNVVLGDGTSIWCDRTDVDYRVIQAPQSEPEPHRTNTVAYKVLEEIVQNLSVATNLRMQAAQLLLQYPEVTG